MESLEIYGLVSSPYHYTLTLLQLHIFHKAHTGKPCSWKGLAVLRNSIASISKYIMMRTSRNRMDNSDVILLAEENHL